MRAYDRIYEALVNGKKEDPNWKGKVDKTIEKFVKKGETKTQAIKSAAKELNTEGSHIKAVDAVFLKAYMNFNKEPVMNCLIDGQAVQVLLTDGTEVSKLPAMPKKVKMTEVDKTKYLLTGRIEFSTTNKTKMEFEKISPEELFDSAKPIAEFADKSWGLVKGEIIEVVGWKEPLVTPNGANLKLNFRSGDARSGFFLTNFDVLKNIVPSLEDKKKFEEIESKMNWNGLLSFVNEVCAENRETGAPGVEILLYGLVTDNKWKDKQGNERVGKNIRLGTGGIVFSVDILYENVDTEVPVQNLEGEAPEEAAPEETPAEAVSETAVPQSEPAPAQPVSPMDAPEGVSVEQQIAKILSDAGPKGLSAQDLVKAMKAVKPNEVASKLNAMMSSKEYKILMKDGKFVMGK